MAALTTEVIAVNEAELRSSDEASVSGRHAAAPHPAIARAVATLAAGDVVAIPTETVYGLAANALSAGAVRRVYAAKGRPADNPLIVHVSSLAMLASLYPPGWSLPDVYAALVHDLWPGPLTILVPRSPLVPEAVTCGQPTMAVRMPSHPVALALIAACGFPLAAPSANSSGRPSPTLARHVVADLGGRIPLVLDGGPCSCGVESTVLDGLRSPPAILRPGGVTHEQLLRYAGMHDLQVYRRDFVDAGLEAAPTTPGMKYRHYSPSAAVWLLDPGAAAPVACTDDELAARLRRGVEDALAELAGRPNGGPAAAPSSDADGDGGGGAHEGAARSSCASGSGLVGVLRTSLVGYAPGPVEGVQLGPADGSTLVEYALGHLARPADVASQLFAALRYMEERRVELIVVEGLRDEGAGMAVMNRLRKAASRIVPV